MTIPAPAHTPGPWRIRENPRNDMDTCDLSICGDIFVIADLNGPQYSHQYANARLIAAAPALVAALQEAVEWDGYDAECVPAVWLENARAALSLALGEQ